MEKKNPAQYTKAKYLKEMDTINKQELDKNDIGHYYLQWGIKRADDTLDDPFDTYSRGRLDGVSAETKKQIMIKQGKFEHTLLKYCYELVRQKQFDSITTDCIKLAAYFTYNELSNGVTIDLT